MRDYESIGAWLWAITKAINGMDGVFHRGMKVSDRVVYYVYHGFRFQSTIKVALYSLHHFLVLTCIPPAA
jgi:hypothetical protein